MDERLIALFVSRLFVCLFGHLPHSFFSLSLSRSLALYLSLSVFARKKTHAPFLQVFGLLLNIKMKFSTVIYLAEAFIFIFFCRP